MHRQEERRRRLTAKTTIQNNKCCTLDHPKGCDYLFVLATPHQDVERLRQELDRYRQEQEQLRQTKARVLVMEERLRDLHWEDEVCTKTRET